jgi:ATP-binding cassette subfamily C (CFTR/MRP) protein 4
MQVRVSLVSAIFSKSLLLPLVAHISSGQIQSFVNSDVQRFEDASGFAHFLWLGPLETLVATYFIYMEIGVAAFAAIGVLLLLIPLQSTFARSLLKYRKATNQSQDHRNKSLSEMISGMVMIKLYSWETPLLNKVRNIRRKELISIQKAAMVRAMNEAFFFASSGMSI